MNDGVLLTMDQAEMQFIEARTTPRLGRWREWIAAFITIGLCWPFIFSGVPGLRWWYFLPVAMLGGILRQRNARINWFAQAPFWLLVIVVLGFFAYGAMAHPLSAYGTDKVLRFLGMAALAYIAVFRQAPISEEFITGIRWSLLATFIISLLFAWLSRDLFLDAERYGVAELRQTFSVTGFPLVIALAVVFALPRMQHPRHIFAAGALLLGAAVVEIFVRGRFHAILLSCMAIVLVLGPPWKYIAGRVLISAVLVGLALLLYLNVLPLLGDSFTYLQWMRAEDIGGRSMLFQEAWQGFVEQPQGRGIGSFQLVEPSIGYPHNFLLEVAYEMGILGLLAVALLYVQVLHRGWRFWLSPPHRIMAAMLVIVFAHMLKAGDIGTLAFQWVFLFLLFVCTPVSADWPLQRKEVA